MALRWRDLALVGMGALVGAAVASRKRTSDVYRLELTSVDTGNHLTPDELIDWTLDDGAVAVGSGLDRIRPAHDEWEARWFDLGGREIVAEPFQTAREAAEYLALQERRA